SWGTVLELDVSRAESRTEPMGIALLDDPTGHVRARWEIDDGTRLISPRTTGEGGSNILRSLDSSGIIRGSVTDRTILIAFDVDPNWPNRDSLRPLHLAGMDDGVCRGRRSINDWINNGRKGHRLTHWRRHR